MVMIEVVRSTSVQEGNESVDVVVQHIEQLQVAEDDESPEKNVCSHNNNHGQKQSIPNQSVANASLEQLLTTTTILNKDAERWSRAVSRVFRLEEEDYDETMSSATTSQHVSINQDDEEEESKPNIDARSKLRGLRLLRGKTTKDASSQSSWQESTATNVSVKETPPLPLPPQFVFQHKASNNIHCFMQDLAGHTVLHALPACIDPRHGAEKYAAALCLYLDEVVNDQDNNKNNNINGDDNHAKDQMGENTDRQQFTILLDVRPGDGWPNPPALDMLSFIKHVACELDARYRTRLHQCLVFPIPRAAIVLWYAARPFLNQRLRLLMQLVPGRSTAKESPPPNDTLAQFLSLQELHKLEEHRVSCFHT